MRTNLMISFGQMYQFDNSILNDYTLPDGMDRKLMNAYIIDFCQHNECRYSDPDLLHALINDFFDTNSYKYSGLWESTQFDYDPVQNYDLTIEETRDHSGGDSTERTFEQSDNTEASVENKVSAFNQSGYSPSEQSESDATSGSKGTENSKTEIDRKEVVSRREYGDNSARSTQYMIKEQREVVDLNVYRTIANEFEDFFTIPVY